MDKSENNDKEVTDSSNNPDGYDPTENCTWWEGQLFQCIIL
jgi:hypothetical protein